MKSLAITTVLICSLCLGAAPERPLIQVKPTILRLDRPPLREYRCSFLLRHTGEGPMSVLSASCTDPAIAVEVKEHPAAGAYVISAILPAGYHTPPGDEVRLVVTTDLKDAPTVRIPVSVSAEPPPVRDPWMARPRAMIGRPAPAVTLRAIDSHRDNNVLPVYEHALEGRTTRGTSISPKVSRRGNLPVDQGLEGPATAPAVDRSTAEAIRRGDTRTMNLGGPGDTLSVVMFWTGRCGHCVRQLPLFQRVAESYAGKPVEFLTICAGERDAGTVIDAARNRGITLPVGLDSGYAASRQYAIKAFPFICVISPKGIIEAVHGRRPTYSDKDGLEHLEADLKTQLDLLLAGKTRADFPATQPAAALPTTRPSRQAAAPRPAAERRVARSAE